MEKDGENKFEAEKELVKGSWLHLFVPHEIQKLQNSKTSNVHPNCDSSHLTPSKSLPQPLPDATLDFISTLLWRGWTKVFHSYIYIYLRLYHFHIRLAIQPQVQVFMGSVP